MSEELTEQEKDRKLSAEGRIFRRYAPQAKDVWKFTQMVGFFREAETHDEMKRISVMMFIPDLSYERADICLALKVVELEKGWR